MSEEVTTKAGYAVLSPEEAEEIRTLIEVAVNAVIEVRERLSALFPEREGIHAALDRIVAETKPGKSIGSWCVNQTTNYEGFAYTAAPFTMYTGALLIERGAKIDIEKLTAVIEGREITES